MPNIITVIISILVESAKNNVQNRTKGRAGIPIDYPLFKRSFERLKQSFKIKLISINFYYELPLILNKYRISKYHIKNII